MTRTNILVALGLMLFAYVSLVLTIGFPGLLAMSIHFTRMAVTIAILLLYGRLITTVFVETPPPSRDFLLTGIIFFVLSAVCFSIWNELGRIFGVDTSIFTGPVSGLFSIMLILAGIFVFLPKETGNAKSKLIIASISIALSIGLVFIAPLFR